MPQELVTSRYNYNFTAWFYQQMASVYSFGQIRASKVSQVDLMHAGDKVLYAGVGTGEDSLAAARKGVELTCVDLSSAMLKRTRNKLMSERLSGELICADIMTHDRREYYDVICANYFLNVFAEPLMEQVLVHLARLLKPGGKIAIADFSLPKGNKLQRALHILYYRIANIFYWMLSGNDLHPIYNYPEYFSRHGIVHDETKMFYLLGWGPGYFHSVIGHKPTYLHRGFST